MNTCIFRKELEADESFCIFQFVVLQSTNQAIKLRKYKAQNSTIPTKSEIMTHSPLTGRGNY